MRLVTKMRGYLVEPEEPSVETTATPSERGDSADRGTEKRMNIENRDVTCRIRLLQTAPRLSSRDPLGERASQVC
jgi:hypothetical protein